MPSVPGWIAMASGSPAIGTEARVKFNCLTNGCWPAWWLLNDNPDNGGEVDLAEWYGNQNWPSGTTVHARLDGTSFATQPFDVDGGWHVWRVTWNDSGMYFWRDYADGMEPYFQVPANSAACATPGCQTGLAIADLQANFTTPGAGGIRTG